MEDKFKFKELKENINRMKVELPVVLANDAQNYFTDTWRKQGFDNAPWQDVKRHDQNTKEFKYPIKLQARKLSSPILVGVYKGRSGGTLRRAVSNSIKSQTFSSVLLQVDLPYAKAQNEGNPDKNLPARKYMGQSPILMQKHREKIKKFMSKLFNK